VLRGALNPSALALALVRARARARASHMPIYDLRSNLNTIEKILLDKSCSS